VHQQEEHQEYRDEEVNGARGLLAAQKSDHGRHGGRDGRGHGQAGPDYQRKQNENDEQIGEPLKHVVRPGVFATRWLQAQMPGDYSRESSAREIGASRKQILPEMACEQSEGYIEQAGQDRDPGGLEMQIAAPSVLIGKHVAIAGGDGGSRGWKRQFEQRRTEYVAGFTPIEARVRKENFYSADEQGEEGQGGDPMSDANERRVP